MKKLSLLFIGWILGLFSLTAQADLLVLVHGYLGSSHSWESSGVNSVLEQNGWQRAGLVYAGPGGIQVIPAAGQQADNKVYSVELPSVAPLTLQAQQLQLMLRQLAERHPGEPLYIAGHSAGGVVARLALVRDPSIEARALVTIASPHLGTARAIEALEETDGSGPVGMIKNLFGGDLYQTVKHSYGALVELTPAYPGNMLYWLNAQNHPDIEYHSIVRPGPVGLGDELVPLFSQDMNNVPALKGKSRVLPVATGHSLNPQDGATLVHLISAS
ncbi:MAG: alpha/beta fold hydrolase [Candidatus Sedimenticola sp. 6PFRAG5]